MGNGARGSIFFIPVNHEARRRPPTGSTVLCDSPLEGGVIRRSIILEEVNRRVRFRQRFH
jgi:hypothetical protein